jgi:hypothetical protein
VTTKRRDFLIGTGGASAALGVLGALAPALPAPADAPTPPLLALDPTSIDLRFDSRSVSFENPTGARGAGGQASHGRKGRPLYILDPGEKKTLADLTGPGTIRHFWTMLCTLPPQIARALRLEVFYDGLSEPSVSVPVLDFFGLPHGRCVEYYSAMTAINEGRGLNSYLPMPFKRSIRFELTNESPWHVMLYYEIDYTLEPTMAERSGYLHATFRRENPTVLRRDFVIAEGLKGPGRFLGCSVGIRVIDKGYWYGEGEVKIYRDGDRDFPTYCGTGLEDYAGSAYGLLRHYGLYSGSPLQVPPPAHPEAGFESNPVLVSFYRWHLPDPVMFAEDLKVTIQQLGGNELFKKGQEVDFEHYQKTHIAAGPGWMTDSGGDYLGSALIERSDDYCATAFVYCQRPQGVPRYKTDVAVRDVALLPNEAKPPSMQTEDQEAVFVKMKKHWNP